MRLAAKQIGLLVLATILVSGNLNAQQAESAKLYTTRSRLITLPYTTPNPGATTNVTLLLSMNYGKTWKQHVQQTPAQKQFYFKAHRDGEFWFCTRTNLQKNVVPLDLEPEMRIYVDTKQPRIQLRAELSANSDIVMHCHVSDPTITPQNVIAEFQPTPEASWQAFPLESPATFLRPGVLQLSGRWSPNIDTRVVTLRVRATDGAKNSSVAYREVFLPPLNLRRTEAYKPIRNPYTGPVPHEGAVRWPADTGPDLQTSEDIHSVTTQTPSDDQPPMQEPPLAKPPANARVHQLNQTRFRLNYDLKNESGNVTEVQLWATEDGGQSWVQWGIDADKQSPLEVEMERDGIYGFKTVVKTPNATTAVQPLPGTLADLWLQVDTTKPQLTPGAITHSNDAGIPEALIRWEATDSNFGPRPIRLHYQSDGEDSWHEISLAVPNTGIYRWSLVPGSSTAWRVKIEAVDKAGNISTRIVSSP